MSNPKRHPDSGGSDLCYGLGDLGGTPNTQEEIEDATRYVKRLYPEHADLLLVMLGLGPEESEEVA